MRSSYALRLYAFSGTAPEKMAASRQSERPFVGVQALACLAPVPIIRQAKA